MLILPRTIRNQTVLLSVFSRLSNVCWLPKSLVPCVIGVLCCLPYVWSTSNVAILQLDTVPMNCCSQLRFGFRPEKVNRIGLSELLLFPEMCLCRMVQSHKHGDYLEARSQRAQELHNTVHDLRLCSVGVGGVEQIDEEM